MAKPMCIRSPPTQVSTQIVIALSHGDIKLRGRMLYLFVQRKFVLRIHCGQNNVPLLRSYCRGMGFLRTREVN